MLQTNDIGVLFATLQACYGHKWAHKSDAIPVWQNALSRFTLPQLMLGADRARKEFPDFPPSLGQFADLCGPRARANTYLPPPKASKAHMVGNRALLKVVLQFGGVDKFQMRNMQDLKTALAAEIEQPTKEWLDDLIKQLTALANNHDKEKKAAEIEVARKAFCVRQGIQA